MSVPAAAWADLFGQLWSRRLEE